MQTPEQKAEWYQKNKLRISADQKKYREDNAERINKQRKEFREKTEARDV